MKKTALILSGLLLSASALAEDGSADAVNGKRLFEENPNKCLRCHADGAGLSAATNMAMLEAKVRNCDVSHQTNWYDDEILDVVAHLNQEHYHFSAIALDTAVPDVIAPEAVALESEESNSPEEAATAEITEAVAQ